MPLLRNGLVELEVQPFLSAANAVAYSFDLRWNGRSLLPAGSLDEPAAFFRACPEGWLYCQGVYEEPLGNAIVAVTDLKSGEDHVWTSSDRHCPRLRLTISRGDPSSGPREATLKLSADGTALSGFCDRRGFVKDDVDFVEMSFAISATVDAVVRFGCEINAWALPLFAEEHWHKRTPLEAALDEPTEPVITPPKAWPFVLAAGARLWAEHAGCLDRLLAAATVEVTDLYAGMVDPELPHDHPDQLDVYGIAFHTFELDGIDFVCSPGESGGQDVLIVRYAGPTA